MTGEFVGERTLKPLTLTVVCFRERNGIIETLYFYSAFILVVLRTAAVSISGGCLNEASKELLPILNTVPTEIYNPEITRLINQIYRTEPFLTGHNLFSVTKGLVLSVNIIFTLYFLVFGGKSYKYSHYVHVCRTVLRK
ncbi:unnamed protein product [Callosobruchus maculatus]|uniref:Uncharacterized protein n=1 Tax=Callosobruchus maculatus TaxID=64391 RepID=A0A653CTD4_CALMS|nr:unnamed protein product [Callosobruchus maculatus]